MTTKYTATLANGETVKRTTMNRTYSHHWRVTAISRKDGTPGTYGGWSGTLDLARKAAANTVSMYTRCGYRDINTEIVEAVIATRAAKPKVKATPAPPFEGRPVWHGKFIVNGKWLTVRNANNLPIIYKTPEAACAAAWLQAPEQAG